MTISEIVPSLFAVIFFICFVVVLDQKQSALDETRKEKRLADYYRARSLELRNRLHEANCKIKELEKPKVNVAISVDAEEFKARLKEISDEIKEQFIFDKAVSEVCYKMHRGDNSSVELSNNKLKTE